MPRYYPGIATVLPRYFSRYFGDFGDPSISKLATGHPASYHLCSIVCVILLYLGEIVASHVFLHNFTVCQSLKKHRKISQTCESKFCLFCLTCILHRKVFNDLIKISEHKWITMSFSPWVEYSLFVSAVQCSSGGSK